MPNRRRPAWARLMAHACRARLTSLSGTKRPAPAATGRGQARKVTPTMHANGGRRNVRPASIPPDPHALSRGEATPVSGAAPPLGRGEEANAIKWLITRHRVRPNLAATVAALAGLDVR
jgi:hypothetical protein